MTLTATLDAPSTPAAPLRMAQRGRLRLLAIALAAQPLLIGFNAVFHPDVDIDGPSILDGAAEGPVRWYVVHLVAALGALLGVPAALALRRLVSERRRLLAGTALVTATVASPLLAMAFVAEASVFHLLADTPVSRVDAVELADAYTATPLFFAVPLAIAGTALASVLFAIALLRDRAVSRWAPVAYLAGTVVSVVAVPGTPVGPIAFAIVAIGAAGLARRLWAGADAETW